MSRHAAAEPLPIADAPPRFDWREWLAFAGCVVGTALFVSVVLGALVLIISTHAIAQPVATPVDAAIERLPDVASPGSADRATLLFRTTQGLKAAPLVSTDVRVEVTGPVVRTTVTQSFDNPGHAWLEGIYAFPLPDDSAVDRLQMRVGERTKEERKKQKDQKKK